MDQCTNQTLLQLWMIHKHSDNVMEKGVGILCDAIRAIRNIGRSMCLCLNGNFPSLFVIVYAVVNLFHQHFPISIEILLVSACDIY